MESTADQIRRSPKGEGERATPFLEISLRGAKRRLPAFGGKQPQQMAVIARSEATKQSRPTQRLLCSLWSLAMTQNIIVIARSEIPLRFRRFGTGPAIPSNQVCQIQNLHLHNDK
ncbi:hypothetical protein KKC87_00205 [Patescibacteria group bacterium]|nr:hypothetical protein [Patescibacteria group bacterium]